MNCPCGQKATTFGPFGNACPAHVPSRPVAVEAARARSRKRQALDRREDLVVVRDVSRCSCGALATRWYEGGASCWFCVARRPSADEKALAALMLAWEANMDRVEGIARRMHRRWSVLNIARQTKNQYPVALRDWALDQVAKVQEDGRLSKVLEASRSVPNKDRLLTELNSFGLLNGLQGKHRLPSLRTWLNTVEALAPSLPKVWPGDEEKEVLNIYAALRDLLQRGVEIKPVDPAPYFESYADAFYRDLQKVPEDQRGEFEVAYNAGKLLVIDRMVHIRGRAPQFDRNAPPGRVFCPKP
jgi:hypothetical protein